MAESKPATHQSQRREAQLRTLIEAAEKRVIQGGVAALKARDLAKDIGVAVGGLYNIVPDMETLALHLSSRTLDWLDTAIEQAAGPMPMTTREEAVQRLTTAALTYLVFARNNLPLWRMVFDVRITAPLPDWHAQTQLRLLRHVSAPLAVIAPFLDEAALATRSRSLFAAVHGVVWLGLEDRLVAAPLKSLADEIGWLIGAACAGTATRL